MTKEQLIAKIKELLKTDADLDFLLDLKKTEIETLIACIRDRVEMVNILWGGALINPKEPI